MFIDYKTTVWERFEIEDEHKGSLLEFLKENPEASAMDIWNWHSDNGGDPHCETLEGTSVEMSPEENDGCSTIEILCEDKIIYQNGAE
jgi:hypothetical protein